MTKFTIDVDLDGVLADIVQITLALLYYNAGFIYYPEDINEYYYEDEFINFDTFLKDAVLNERMLMLVPVIGGAVSGMKKLLKFGAVRIPTARKYEFFNITAMWLDVKGIQYTELVALNGNNKGISLAGGNVLIDDYYKNIIDYLSVDETRKGILFPTSYSKPKIKELVTMFGGRVYIPSGNNTYEIWNSILYIVDALSQEFNSEWKQLEFT